MCKKSFIWLNVSFASFICLVIATMGFGFRYKMTNEEIGLFGDQYMDLPKMGRLIKSDAFFNGGAAFIKDSYALMVSGFVFATLAILLSLLAIYLTTSKTRFKNQESLREKWVMKTWHFIELGIFLGFALTFSGELLYSIKSYEEFKKLPIPGNSNLTFGEYWKITTFIGMLVVTIIPLISLVWTMAVPRNTNPKINATESIYSTDVQGTK